MHFHGVKDRECGDTIVNKSSPNVNFYMSFQRLSIWLNAALSSGANSEPGSQYGGVVTADTRFSKHLNPHVDLEQLDERSAGQINRQSMNILANVNV